MTEPVRLSKNGSKLIDEAYCINFYKTFVLPY